jgi:hypothetical protein
MKTSRPVWPFLLVSAIAATIYIATWGHNVKQDLDKYGNQAP